MGGHPSGTVTFVFTDIEGSTRLWQEAPEAMTQALARHDALLLGIVDQYEGFVFSTGGDGFGIAFPRAADALTAAGDIQRALHAEPWPDDAPIRVRIGVHTGEAVERDDNYFGPAVNASARLMALAHGGQVLCSATTLSLVEDAPIAVDLGEHRLRDVITPVRVHQLGGGEFPPLRTALPAASNLPVPATELVGRDEDVEAILAAMQDSRLVTLTGAGGIGKTRLAIAAAARAVDGYPDGVWFVDLAAVGDAGDIVPAIAAGMGATAAASSSEVLLGYLEGRRALLVVDNCEHLIDDVHDVVTAVLRRAPEMAVLATSREPLDADGETVKHVRPLALPEGAAHLGDVERCAALRLFVERARSVQEDFDVTDDNLDDVVEICRRLDGVPLAIELAAARMGSLRPTDIRAHLDERFRLLGGGRRGLERHRTLLAAVSWSYDLLSTREQRVFWRLSVFAGSFDLSDAVAVVRDDDTSELDVLDDLGRLVERSLVNHDPAAGRYRLLETLRQYGADRLLEAGEADDVNGRFADHFLAIMQREGPRIGSDYVEAWTVLATAFDNIRASAEWLAHVGRWDDLASLITAGWHFMNQEAPDTCSWIRPVLDAEVTIEPQHLYDATLYSAIIAMVSGNFDDALDLDERARSVLDANPDVQESAWSLHVPIIVELFTDGPSLTDLAERMVDLSAKRGDPYAELFARSLACMSVDLRTNLARLEGEVCQLIEEAAARGPMWVGIVLSNCGGALVSVGDDPRRWKLLLELLDAHPAWETTGSVMKASILGCRATALASVDPEEALAVAIEATELSDRLGVAHATATALHVMVYVALSLDMDEPAATLLRHARALSPWDNPYNRWLRERSREILAERGIELADGESQLLPRSEVFALLAHMRETCAGRGSTGARP